MGTKVGNPAWFTALAPGSIDIPLGIVIDASGTLYVTTISGLNILGPDGSLKMTLPGGANASPAVGTNGTVYVPLTGNGTNGDGLEALNPTNGMPIWTVGPQSDQYATAAIRGDGMILASAGASLAAWSPAGALAWTSAPDGNFGLDSSVAVAPDGHAYVVFFSKGLVAIRPDGTTAWMQLLQGFSGSDPVVGPDGTIFVGNGGHAYATHPDGTASWDVELVPPATQPHMTETAIAPDGTLYMTGYDDVESTLYHLSPSDGSVLWKVSHPGIGAGRPVIDATGDVYVSVGGTVYAVHPDSTQIWAFTPASSPGNDPCLGVAIGKDGTVYASYASGVYALE